MINAGHRILQAIIVISLLIAVFSTDGDDDWQSFKQRYEKSYQGAEDIFR
jgi:hypothetical protein